VFVLATSPGVTAATGTATSPTSGRWRHLPPRCWKDISALIPTDVDLERRIRDHAIDILVLRYDRDGHAGAVVVEVWPTTSGDIAVRRLRSAATTIASMQMRAGPHRQEIEARRIAIVGVGALGSFIADLLIRAHPRRR
jgi:hypothetical protein